MGLDLAILQNPKIKALLTGAFLLGGIVFSILTYFMLVSSKPEPVEITYTSGCGTTLGSTTDQSVSTSVPVSLKLPQLSELSSTKGGSPSGRQSGSLVNINTASVAQLDKLPGIGPAFAQRIVEYRESNGDFTSTQELMRVKGIGQKTYEELKDLVVTK